jgi:hypothetical protein
MTRRGALATLAAMRIASVSQTISNGMLYQNFGKDRRESIGDRAGRLSHRGPRGRHPDRP